MSYTAQDVFERTMALIDEIDDNGDADTSDTVEYKNKTLAILNVLGGELFPYSDNFAVETEGQRPIFTPITDFDTEISLDGYITGTVMPYGLAAHLMLDENPSAASYFNQRFEELKALLARGLPVSSEDIEDVYGTTGYHPYNEFGRWG